MIAFDKSDIIEGVTVYADHADFRTFYLLPNTPRFRLDERKAPVFKFIKYRMPVDRADGKKGGGFVIFDVEFTVEDAVREKVRGVLQERLDQRFKNVTPKPQVILGQLRPVNNSTLSKPAATVQFLDSGGALVQRILNPGAPSLYGNFITPITVELSPEGAALCEQALQGKGGVVQVAYNLPMVVRLPPIRAEIHFWAQRFMHYHQEMEKRKTGGGLFNWCRAALFGGESSRRERRELQTEFFSSSESASIVIDAGAVTDQKVVGAVREWATGELEAALQRMVLKEIDPVSEEQRKINEAYNKVTKDIIVSRLVDFHRYYNEGMAMEWDPAPRGTLPNITNIPGVKWADHAIVADLDSDFFKQLNLNIQPNIDFANLPIQSIDVNVEYAKGGGKKEVKGYNFKTPNDVAKFTTFVENNNWKYKFSYQVNYKGQSQVFKMPPVESEELSRTINVGDVGIVTVDLLPGDLDWDQLRAAQITVRYEPTGAPAVEQQFLMDKEHQTHRFQKIVFKPVDKPYKFRVKYLMKDNKEYLGDWQSSSSSVQLINDVWNATKTVSIRGRGNFETDVDAILLDLVYSDAANKYTQTKSLALDAQTKFIDWSFPVISETTGTLSYSGTIKYKNNSEEAIPKTETSDNTILVGPKVTGFLKVDIMPDLIDFELVKLAKISLQYTDQANAINAKKDVVFKPGATETINFEVQLKDKAKTAYQWQAIFFMADGTSRKTPLLTTEELTLVPQLSDAPAA